MKEQQNWLTVYKASAGSGKTFTLAVSYIELLVRQPDNFRNILAVTFTNKATDEMKQRILGQLYGIWLQLPDSQAYLDRVCADTGMDRATVRSNAGTALRLILHSYSYFRVQTIDAFFQQVLRNLQHELELNANLRVSLEDKFVLSQAVDNLIDGLSERAPELCWITDFIREKIDDDRAWNVIGTIKGFGENIFSDFYKENAKALNQLDSDAIPRYKKEMNALRTEAEKGLQALGDAFFDFLDRNGITTGMLSNGESGAAGYFVKLRNLNKYCFDTEQMMKGRVLKAIDDPTTWVTKANLKKGTIPLDILEAMSSMIADAEPRRLSLVRQYKSAKASQQYLYQLRLLKSIADRVRQNNRDAFQYQLSDTQTLLHRLIDNQDSPFIYEKIGTRLEHIMIDEFQDTGTIQWANFRVLLMDCISQYRGSLIVGDVKQSIYRWRGGDWQILNRFGEQVPPERFVEVGLDVNRRSARNIVSFNDAFFTVAKTLAYDQGSEDPQREALIEKAYEDVVQQVAPNKQLTTGLVEIQLLPEKAPDEDVISQTADCVQRLLSAGARPADIGIITRGNQEIQDIANYFQTALPQVPLVSDEAFKLKASIAVSTIIDALRVMTDEGNLLAIASLTKVWLSEIEQDPDAELKMVMAEKDFDSLLPADFSAANRKRLLSRPLADIAEELYRCFRLDTLPGQGAYVCTFFDLLADTVGNGCTSPRAFLEEWDNKLSEKSIESDDINGIRLLTIHKSKGLEFNHVILPFCDWELEKRNVVWCKPKEQPYAELPIVPVLFTKANMAGSVYEEDYREEHFQNMVDNLNLLYVAFTRPRENLFVIGRRKDGRFRSELIEKVLPAVQEQLNSDETPCQLLTDDETGAISFSYGTLQVTERKREQTENVFEMESEPIDFSMSSEPAHAQFRQGNQSRDFITGDDDERRRRQYMLTGSVLHALLSRIRTTDDIEPELARMERLGIIYDHTLSRPSLIKLLRKRLDDERVRDWFSPRWTVFNECNILTLDPDLGRVVQQRPDRVITNGEETLVIDFKFARQREEHKQQVRRYMSLLTEMGHPHVKGCLWYVYPNMITTVE